MTRDMRLSRDMWRSLFCALLILTIFITGLFCKAMNKQATQDQKIRVCIEHTGDRLGCEQSLGHWTE
jgi:hypothetical protein